MRRVLRQAAAARKSIFSVQSCSLSAQYLDWQEPTISNGSHPRLVWADWLLLRQKPMEDRCLASQVRRIQLKAPIIRSECNWAHLNMLNLV